jgi:glutamate carboxypeptidase
MQDADGGLRLLQELVAVESPTGHIPGVRRVMEVVADHLDGFTVRWHEHGGAPLLEVSRGEDGPLLLGHADTMWPLGTLGGWPLHVAGDFVSGPGVLDMKAGLVTAVLVMRDLPGEVPCTLLVTPGEEHGANASLIESRARHAPLVLVLEPGTDGGGFKTARPGVGRFHLAIRGPEGHVGLDGDHGPGAIGELARQVTWLESLASGIVGTTVNVGRVRGGTEAGIVAGEAEAEIDVRVWTEDEAHRIRQALSAPPRYDPRLEVLYDGDFLCPPMVPGRRVRGWLDRAAAIWRELSGEKPTEVRVRTASGGNFAATRTPTLDGLGPYGGGERTREERVWWPSVRLRAALVRSLVEAAAEV